MPITHLRCDGLLKFRLRPLASFFDGRLLDRQRLLRTLPSFPSFAFEEAQPVQIFRQSAYAIVGEGFAILTLKICQVAANGRAGHSELDGDCPGTQTLNVEVMHFFAPQLSILFEFA